MNDIKIVEKYWNKLHDAKNRKIEFSLSFTAFKNMMRAKKCYYTGIQFRDGPNGELTQYSRTIDRIDSSKGYIKGNCVACCSAVNLFKSKLENENSIINPLTAQKIIKKTLKKCK